LPSARAQISAANDAVPAAHFHHVHLNTTDPAAAVEFYTSKFRARKERFAGLSDGVWTGDSWLMFTKVGAAPPSELVSAIWHIGWGAVDMRATYQEQLEAGTRFHTPLTDLAPLVGRSFYYAYVDGPDHALIELNTAVNRSFGHVHLFSASPPRAAEWYQKYLGIRVARVQREPRSVTWPTCRPLAKSCCSIAAGTTGLAWSA
jgi:catechol 2,3-dioxygenase-like lactoylglutathione lyase family enzyme